MHAQLSNDITGKVLMGITIPPCPASLTNIMREAKRPSSRIDSLANLINSDAGIVAPLIKLANSPFIGLRSKVTSALQAVSVLGMQNTLNLVQNIALRQSVGYKSQSFDKFWERSSLTASIAEKIAAKFMAVSKDDAYIATLFHDCGIPVLMMKYPEYRETIMVQCQSGKPICDIENDSFSTSHAMVGHMLTRNWMLQEHICKAILYHHDTDVFASMDGGEETAVRDLIGIIHMAECIADEHLNVKNTEWCQVEQDVLNHFEISDQEFLDRKEDILVYLNGG